MGQIWKKEVKKLMTALMPIKRCAKDGICSYRMFNTESPCLSSEVNTQKLWEGGKSHEVNNIWPDTSAGHGELISWHGGESSSKKRLLEERFIVCSKMKRIPPEKINLGYLIEMKRLQRERERNTGGLTYLDSLRGIFGICFLQLASQSLAALLPELSLDGRFKIARL
jgi:hypothetical protein